MAYFIFSSFQGPAFGKICPAAPEICGFKPLSKRQKLQALTQPFPFLKVSPLLSHISPLCSICLFPLFPTKPKSGDIFFLIRKLNDSLQYVIFDWAKNLVLHPVLSRTASSTEVTVRRSSKHLASRDTNITRDVLT